MGTGRLSVPALPQLLEKARRWRIVAALLVTLVTVLWAVRGLHQAHTPAGDPAPVPVVVARQAIAAGTRVTPAMVGVWPRQAAPEGAVRDPRALAGMIAIRDIAPGQVILRGAVAPPDQVFGAAAAVPGRMRAMTLVVAPSQAFAGRIAPGSRVDVIAVSGSGGVPQASLLAPGVEVLRVGGQAPAGAPSRSGGPSGGVEVTVALAPDLITPVALAQVHGQLLLALHPVRGVSPDPAEAKAPPPPPAHASRAPSHEMPSSSLRPRRRAGWRTAPLAVTSRPAGEVATPSVPARAPAATPQASSAPPPAPAPPIPPAPSPPSGAAPASGRVPVEVILGERRVLVVVPGSEAGP